MTNARIAVEKIYRVTPDEMRKGNIKSEYEHVNMHMIFYIKIYGKFTRNERLVGYGHTPAPSSSITYSSVISRESVRIEFLIESLDDLDIFECVIGNAYLNAKCREKVWT